MTKHEANTKFIECARLLGLQTEYFSGMFRVRSPEGMYLGMMSAESWLAHLVNCMASANRS